MEWFTNLGVFAVPVAAIIVGGVIAIIAIIAMVHSHQERMAKIERGMDPDAKR
jgi:hypothetical protein